MRPVSSVSLRPPHSMDLRLISNISVGSFFLPQGPISSGLRTGTERLFSSRLRKSSPIDGWIEDLFAAPGVYAGFIPLLSPPTRLGREKVLIVSPVSYTHL